MQKSLKYGEQKFPPLYSQIWKMFALEEKVKWKEKIKYKWHKEELKKQKKKPAACSTCKNKKIEEKYMLALTKRINQKT